jgi:hypothetical protein
VTHTVHVIPLFRVLGLCPDTLRLSRRLSVVSDCLEVDLVVPIAVYLDRWLGFTTLRVDSAHFTVEAELFFCEPATASEVDQSFVLWDVSLTIVSELHSSDNKLLANVDVHCSNDQIMRAQHGGLDFVPLAEVVQVDVGSVLLQEA